jgi:hypothetical protein
LDNLLNLELLGIAQRELTGNLLNSELLGALHQYAELRYNNVMVKLKAKYRYVLWVLAFIFYAFLAARPVPEETVFVSKWLKSLASSFPEKFVLPGAEYIPFCFGGHYGYVSLDGAFTINQEKKSYIEQSPGLFAEFSGQDEKIAVRDFSGKQLFMLEDKRGYPFFRGERIFVIHSEQNSISEVNFDNDTLWTYDFASPVTCADVSGGFLLIGELDGSIELLDRNGKRVYFTEPSGSRVPVIYGCAIAKSGTKFAVISGLDRQRFLVVEQVGDVWRITHHEFLGYGFNRPVHIKFVDDERRVVYERQEGLGIYNMASRSSEIVSFDGQIVQIDDFGEDDMFFLVVSESAVRKKLIAIRYPAGIVISAPFSSQDSFLKRKGNLFFVGGGNKLSAFEITKM